MEEEKAIKHKDKSMRRLGFSFMKHIRLKEFKQSHLLSYWINDFAIYHDEERTFDLSKSGRYVRGKVIKVNFGYNIGNEFGGLHYCIGLINQITTVSKQRIFNDSSMKKFRISSKNLDLIDKKIADFFIKKRESC